MRTRFICFVCCLLFAVTTVASDATLTIVDGSLPVDVVELTQVSGSLYSGTGAYFEQVYAVWNGTDWTLYVYQLDSDQYGWNDLDPITFSGDGDVWGYYNEDSGTLIGYVN